MAQHIVRGGQVKQRMLDAAVAHVNLGRFDKALADIASPRHQAPHQLQVNHQVGVTHNGWRRHPQAGCEPRLIQQAALAVRQHGPQAAKRLCGHAWRKHGQVPLQIRADKVLPPRRTGEVTLCQQAFRKAATQPKRLTAQLGRAGFKHIDGPHLKISNTAC